MTDVPIAHCGHHVESVVYIQRTASMLAVLGNQKEGSDMDYRPNIKDGCIVLTKKQVEELRDRYRSDTLNTKSHGMWMYYFGKANVFHRNVKSIRL